MRGDWARALEATYAPAESHEAWGTELIEAMRPLFGGASGVNLFCMQHTADCGTAWPIALAGDSAREEAAGFFDSHRAAGGAGFRSFYYPDTIVTTTRAVFEGLDQATREKLAHFAWRVESMVDLGLVVHPQPGVVVVVDATYEGRLELDRTLRHRFTQLALHIETGFRLRLRPESVMAVLSSDGKLLHREPGCPSLDAMNAHVRGVEAARTKGLRETPEALDLWSGLISGSASVVERREGSRRHYLVVENAPATQPMRVLTRGEIDAVSYAARGLSAKLVAYTLGLSEPTVSSRLASAAGKIGVATRVELVRLAAMLTRDPRARFEETALTTAEKDVLELLAQGLSNREIAAIRSRSLRTIANQVAALLRKTESPTRRALVARHT